MDLVPFTLQVAVLYYTIAKEQDSFTHTVFEFLHEKVSTGFNTRQYMVGGEVFYNGIDLDHVVDHTHLL